MRFLRVAGKVEIEIVLEGLARDWAALDFGEVQAGGGEARQNAVQGTGPVGKGKAQADLIGPLWDKHMPVDGDEPGAVVCAVLDILRQDVQAVLLRGGFRADRRSTGGALLGHFLCSSSGGGTGDGLEAVLCDEIGTLCQRLRMGIRQMDLGNRAFLRGGQAVMDVERFRCHNVETVTQDQVVHLADGTGGGIFHRQHTEVRPAVGDSGKNRSKVIKKERLGTGIEVLDGFMGKRTADPQTGDALRARRRMFGVLNKLPEFGAASQQIVLQGTAHIH